MAGIEPDVREDESEGDHGHGEDGVALPTVGESLGDRARAMKVEAVESCVSAIEALDDAEAGVDAARDRVIEAYRTAIELGISRGALAEATERTPSWVGSLIRATE